ncbi:MAG TPA: GNAT family N-acetyltransferase [Bryobacteraceae bacterium]|nr:GNAT family N-acetyltransferase [Bryobacteraceae bacterium]
MDFECVADNLRESFRVLAESRNQGEVRELRGVSIASANVTFQMFNAAFLSTPVLSEADLEQRILLAATHFRQRARPWAYWVCEDWLEDRARKRAMRLFERHGLRHTVNLPGMLAERLLPPVKPPAPLEIRRVENGPVREAFCAIGSLCFNVPLAWFSEVFDAKPVWNRFVAYVGYSGGEPVTSAAVVMGAGAAGVYNVATLPNRQRKGYGETVVRHALEEVRREYGIERTILQSTPAGYRLYERMGYRPVTRVAVYSS